MSSKGNLEFKDFDIQKEVGGSFRAVAKDFTARILFLRTVNNEPPNKATTKKNRTGMIVGIVLSVGASVIQFREEKVKQDTKMKFVAEIEIISAVQHRNLVKLYGCCIEGEKRLLVYEHLENKSLDLALFVHTAELESLFPGSSRKMKTLSGLGYTLRHMLRSNKRSSLSS
ncbi:hypothetical protein ACS0TY_014387 [Phlomoides rotata]